MDRWDGPYLKKELPIDPWGKPYLYRIPGEKAEFDIVTFDALQPGVESGRYDLATMDRARQHLTKK